MPYATAPFCVSRFGLAERWKQGAHLFERSRCLPLFASAAPVPRLQVPIHPPPFLQHKCQAPAAAWPPSLAKAARDAAQHGASATLQPVPRHAVTPHAAISLRRLVRLLRFFTLVAAHPMRFSTRREQHRRQQQRASPGTQPTSPATPHRRRGCHLGQGYPLTTPSPGSYTHRAQRPEGKSPLRAAPRDVVRHPQRS